MGQWLEVALQKVLYIRKTWCCRGGGRGSPTLRTVLPEAVAWEMCPARVPASSWVQDCETGWSGASWVISAAWQKLLVEAEAVLAVDLILLLFKSAIKLL